MNYWVFFIETKIFYLNLIDFIRRSQILRYQTRLEKSKLKRRIKFNQNSYTSNYPGKIEAIWCSTQWIGWQESIIYALTISFKGQGKLVKEETTK